MRKNLLLTVGLLILTILFLNNVPAVRNENNPFDPTDPNARNINNFGRSTQILGSALGGLASVYQIGGPRSFQLSAKLRF